ncbi:MAG: hypothetical protein ACRDUX_05245 [Mycobacterium sp.]
MRSRWITLTVLAASLLPFSSCTCHQQTPEPPAKPAERAGGFGVKAATRRPLELPPVAELSPVGALAPTNPPEVPPGEGKEVSVPDSFPSDVPLPEGSEVVAVQDLANNAHNVVFSAEGDPKKIFNFYKDTLTKKDWNVTQEYEGKEQSFLTFKKDKTVTNMVVTTDPKTGKRVVAIMYYDEEPLPFPEF